MPWVLNFIERKENILLLLLAILQRNFLISLVCVWECALEYNLRLFSRTSFSTSREMYKKSSFSDKTKLKRCFVKLLCRIIGTHKIHCNMMSKRKFQFIKKIKFVIGIQITCKSSSNAFYALHCLRLCWFLDSLEIIKIYTKMWKSIWKININFSLINIK